MADYPSGSQATSNWADELESDENRLLLDEAASIEEEKVTRIPETELETEQEHDTEAVSDEDSTTSSTPPCPPPPPPLHSGPLNSEFRAMYNALMHLERCRRREDTRIPGFSNPPPIPELITDEATIQRLAALRNQYMGEMKGAYAVACRHQLEAWASRVEELTEDWLNRFQSADKLLEKARGVARSYLAREALAINRRMPRKRRRDELEDDTNPLPHPTSSSNRENFPAPGSSSTFPNQPSSKGKGIGKKSGKRADSRAPTPAPSSFPQCVVTLPTPEEAKTSFRKEAEREEQHQNQRNLRKRKTVSRALDPLCPPTNEGYVVSEDEENFSLSLPPPKMAITRRPPSSKNPEELPEASCSSASSAKIRKRSSRSTSSRSSASATASTSGTKVTARASSRSPPNSVIIAQTVYILDDTTAGLKKYLGTSAITVHIPGNLRKLKKCLTTSNTDWLPNGRRYVVFAGNEDVLEDTHAGDVLQDFKEVHCCLERAKPKAEIVMVTPLILNEGTRKFASHVQPLINSQIVAVLPSYSMSGQRRAKGDKHKLSSPELRKLALELQNLFG